MNERFQEVSVLIQYLLEDTQTYLRQELSLITFSANPENDLDFQVQDVDRRAICVIDLKAGTAIAALEKQPNDGDEWADVQTLAIDLRLEGGLQYFVSVIKDHLAAR